MTQQTRSASDVTALVPVGQAVESLDLAPASQQINVLGPRAVVHAGEGMRLRPVLVKVSAQPQDGDVYLREGKLALTKVGLLKLAEAKGVIWSDAHSRRVDDAPPCNACSEKARETGRPPICNHNVGFRKVGAWLDPAGQWESHAATKYWLYDDELAEVQRTYRAQVAKGKIKQSELQAKVDAEFEKRFRDRLALAETKAMLRVIREIGLKAGYTAQELEKGFLCVRVEPDLSAEEAKRRGLASASQIFGPEFSSSAPALPAPDYDEAQELDGEGAAEGEAAEESESLGPWDDDPPQPTREEVLRRVKTDWTAAAAALKAGNIEDMPPKPPAKDAPIAALLDWCEKCEAIFGIGGET